MIYFFFEFDYGPPLYGNVKNQISVQFREVIVNLFFVNDSAASEYYINVRRKSNFLKSLKIGL